MEWVSNLWNTFTSWWSSGWNTICDWVLGFLNGFFGSLGEYFTNWIIDQGLEVYIPTEVFKITKELFRGIAYVFPVASLLPIPLFMLAFYILKIVLSLYQWFASTVITRVHLKL